MTTDEQPIDRRYFFDGGLRFECTQCGQCCTGSPGAVRVSEVELDALAKLRGVPREEFVRDFVRTIPGIGPSLIERADGSCIFFADGKCSVYPARPAQCRTYPFWLKNLRSEEAWHRAARACPGIGTGPYRDREEILRTVGESPV
jgi:Fe-S-cluster containining protein